MNLFAVIIIVICLVHISLVSAATVPCPSFETSSTCLQQNQACAWNHVTNKCFSCSSCTCADLRKELCFLPNSTNPKLPALNSITLPNNQVCFFCGNLGTCVSASGRSSGNNDPQQQYCRCSRYSSDPQQCAEKSPGTCHFCPATRSFSSTGNLNDNGAQQQAACVSTTEPCPCQNPKSTVEQCNCSQFSSSVQECSKVYGSVCQFCETTQKCINRYKTITTKGKDAATTLAAVYCPCTNPNDLTSVLECPCSAQNGISACEAVPYFSSSCQWCVSENSCVNIKKKVAINSSSSIIQEIVCPCDDSTDSHQCGCHSYSSSQQLCESLPACQYCSTYSTCMSKNTSLNVPPTNPTSFCPATSPGRQLNCSLFGKSLCYNKTIQSPFAGQCVWCVSSNTCISVTEANNAKCDCVSGGTKNQPYDSCNCNSFDPAQCQAAADSCSLCPDGSTTLSQMNYCVRRSANAEIIKQECSCESLSTAAQCNNTDNQQGAKLCFWCENMQTCVPKAGLFFSAGHDPHQCACESIIDGNICSTNPRIQEKCFTCRLPASSSVSVCFNRSLISSNQQQQDSFCTDYGKTCTRMNPTNCEAIQQSSPTTCSVIEFTDGNKLCVPSQNKDLCSDDVPRELCTRSGTPRSAICKWISINSSSSTIVPRATCVNKNSVSPPCYRARNEDGCLAMNHFVSSAGLTTNCRWCSKINSCLPENYDCFCYSFTNLFNSIGDFYNSTAAFVNPKTDNYFLSPDAYHQYCASDDSIVADDHSTSLSSSHCTPCQLRTSTSARTVNYCRGNVQSEINSLKTSSLDAAVLSGLQLNSLGQEYCTAKPETFDPVTCDLFYPNTKFCYGEPTSPSLCFFSNSVLGNQNETCSERQDLETRINKYHFSPFKCDGLDEQTCKNPSLDTFFPTFGKHCSWNSTAGWCFTNDQMVIDNCANLSYTQCSLFPEKCRAGVYNLVSSINNQQAESKKRFILPVDNLIRLCVPRKNQRGIEKFPSSRVNASNYNNFSLSCTDIENERDCQLVRSLVTSSTQRRCMWYPQLSACDYESLPDCSSLSATNQGLCEATIDSTAVSDTAATNKYCKWCQEFSFCYSYANQKQASSSSASSAPICSCESIGTIIKKGTSSSPFSGSICGPLHNCYYCFGDHCVAPSVKQYAPNCTTCSLITNASACNKLTSSQCVWASSIQMCVSSDLHDSTATDEVACYKIKDPSVCKAIEKTFPPSENDKNPLLCRQQQQQQSTGDSIPPPCPFPIYCKWCENTQTCAWGATTCDCQSWFGKETCEASPNPQCKWCGVALYNYGAWKDVFCSTNCFGAQCPSDLGYGSFGNDGFTPTGYCGQHGNGAQTCKWNSAVGLVSECLCTCNFAPCNGGCTGPFSPFKCSDIRDHSTCARARYCRWCLWESACVDLHSGNSACQCQFTDENDCRASKDQEGNNLCRWCSGSKVCQNVTEKVPCAPCIQQTSLDTCHAPDQNGQCIWCPLGGVLGQCLELVHFTKRAPESYSSSSSSSDYAAQLNYQTSTTALYSASCQASWTKFCNNIPGILPSHDEGYGTTIPDVYFFCRTAVSVTGQKSASYCAQQFGNSKQECIAYSEGQCRWCENLNVCVDLNESCSACSTIPIKDVIASNHERGLELTPSSSSSSSFSCQVCSFQMVAVSTSSNSDDDNTPNICTCSKFHNNKDACLTLSREFLLSRNRIPAQFKNPAPGNQYFCTWHEEFSLCLNEFDKPRPNSSLTSNCFVFSSSKSECESSTTACSFCEEESRCIPKFQQCGCRFHDADEEACMSSISCEFCPLLGKCLKRSFPSSTQFSNQVSCGACFNFHGNESGCKNSQVAQNCFWDAPYCMSQLQNPSQDASGNTDPTCFHAKTETECNQYPATCIWFARQQLCYPTFAQYVPDLYNPVEPVTVNPSLCRQITGIFSYYTYSRRTGEVINFDNYDKSSIALPLCQLCAGEYYSMPFAFDPAPASVNRSILTCDCESRTTKAECTANPVCTFCPSLNLCIASFIDSGEPTTSAVDSLFSCNATQNEFLCKRAATSTSGALQWCESPLKKTSDSSSSLCAPTKLWNNIPFPCSCSTSSDQTCEKNSKCKWSSALRLCLSSQLFSSSASSLVASSSSCWSTDSCECNVLSSQDFLCTRSQSCYFSKPHINPYPDQDSVEKYLTSRNIPSSQEQEVFSWCISSRDSAAGCNTFQTEDACDFFSSNISSRTDHQYTCQWSSSLQLCVSIALERLWSSDLRDYRNSPTVQLNSCFVSVHQKSTCDGAPRGCTWCPTGITNAKTSSTTTTNPVFFQSFCSSSDVNCQDCYSITDSISCGLSLGQCQWYSSFCGYSSNFYKNSDQSSASFLSIDWCVGAKTKQICEDASLNKFQNSSSYFFIPTSCSWNENLQLCSSMANSTASNAITCNDLMYNEFYCSYATTHCATCSSAPNATEHKGCYNKTTQTADQVCSCSFFDNASSSASCTEAKCQYCSSSSSSGVCRLSCVCNLLSPTDCQKSVDCHLCPSLKTCLPKALDCTCPSLGQTYCHIAPTSCKWCSNLKATSASLAPGVCLPIQDSFGDCSCTQLETSTDCSFASGSCAFCSAQSSQLKMDVCVAKSTIEPQDSCSCASLSENDCLFVEKNHQQLQPSCSFCGQLTNSCLAVHACTCENLPPNDCTLAAQRESCQACGLPIDVFKRNTPVPFCIDDEDQHHDHHPENSSSNTSTTCPRLCQGAGTDEQLCLLAGCYFHGVCQGSPCFSYFLPSYHAQPFALLFLGLFKDAFVLVLIGLISSPILRVILDKWYRVKTSDDKKISHKTRTSTVYLTRTGKNVTSCREDHHESQENKSTYYKSRYPQLNVADTIKNLNSKKRFALSPDEINNDEAVDDDDQQQQQRVTPREVQSPRNNDDDGETSMDNKAKTFNHPTFEAYCNLVREELFEIVSKQEENGEEDNEQSTTQRSFLRIQSGNAIEHENLLNEMIGVVLVDLSVWVKLGGETEEGSDGNNDDPSANSIYTEELDSNLDNNSTLGDRNEENSASLLSSSSSSSAVVRTKTKLNSQTDFKSIFQLRALVQEVINREASEFVFYEDADTISLRVSQSLGETPTEVQLAMYLGGFLLLLLPTMYHILSISSSDSSSNPGEITESSILPPKDEYPSVPFFLIGFRVMNSSSLATAILVFMKVARAAWRNSVTFKRAFYFFSFKDVDDTLNMTTSSCCDFSERIKALSLFSNKIVLTMTVFFFLLISPFCFASVTFGLGVSWPGPIAFLVGVLVLILNFVVVQKLFSRSSSSKKEQKRSLRHREIEVQVPGSNELVLEDDDNDQADRFSSPDSSGDQEDEEASSVADEESGNFTHLIKSLFTFFIQQEFPTFICSICLSLAFNYTALLYVKEEFRISDPSTVIEFDFRARSLGCLYWTIQDQKTALANHVSYFIQTFSSVIPGL